jgi:hypothetical protein
VFLGKPEESCGDGREEKDNAETLRAQRFAEKRSRSVIPSLPAAGRRSEESLRLSPTRFGSLRVYSSVRGQRRVRQDIISTVIELTQLQMETMQRLFEAGFRPIAIAPYENALCVHRGEYAAVLAPIANGGLRLLAPPTVMVDGNLSVRLKKRNGDVFVWKQKEVAATEERLKELTKFRGELEGILELAGKQ